MSTAIVSILPERIAIAAFYPRRERGPRTFLKFWWPPPDGPRLLPGYNPYELLVLLQAVVCVVYVSRCEYAPPHRSFSTGSPLRVPVCLLRLFVYTTGVLTVDKPALYVCVMRIQTHIRERKKMRKKEERWWKWEIDDMYLRITGLFLRISKIRSQSNREGSTRILARAKSTDSKMECGMSSWNLD